MLTKYKGLAVTVFTNFTLLEAFLHLSDPKDLIDYPGTASDMQLRLGVSYNIFQNISRDVIAAKFAKNVNQKLDAF